MAVSRAVHIALYVLYLVALAVLLWFLLYFTDVPAWVWILLVVPLAIFAIGLAIKETVMKGTKIVNGPSVYHANQGWEIFYVIAHIMAFLILGVGFIFVMLYSNIQWWVWPFFGLGIVFTIMATMFLGLLPGNRILPLVFGILGVGSMVTGLILILALSSAPWWVWILGALTALLLVLTGLFEFLAEENVTVTQPVQYITPGVTVTQGAPTHFHTVTTTQLGSPEHVVVHTGQYDSAGRPLYTVVHTQPHAGQHVSRTPIPVARTIPVQSTPLVQSTPAPTVQTMPAQSTSIPVQSTPVVQSTPQYPPAPVITPASPYPTMESALTSTTNVVEPGRTVTYSEQPPIPSINRGAPERTVTYSEQPPTQTTNVVEPGRFQSSSPTISESGMSPPSFTAPILTPRYSESSSTMATPRYTGATMATPYYSESERPTGATMATPRYSELSSTMATPRYSEPTLATPRYSESSSTMATPQYTESASSSQLFVPQERTTQAPIPQSRRPLLTVPPPTSYSNSTAFSGGIETPNMVHGSNGQTYTSTIADVRSHIVPNS